MYDYVSFVVYVQSQLGTCLNGLLVMASLGHKDVQPYTHIAYINKKWCFRSWNEFYEEKKKGRQERIEIKRLDRQQQIAGLSKPLAEYKNKCLSLSLQ